MNPAVIAHALSADLKIAVERARLAGFDGVVLDPSAFPAIADPSRTSQREIIHTLSRAGQAPVAIDVRMATEGLNASARSTSRRGDVDREIERLGRAIDIARGVGSPLVLCDLGPLPPAADEPPPKPLITKAALGALILPDMSGPPVSAPPPAPVQRDTDFEGAVDHALRAIGERADRAGCLVAFRASLGSFASLAAALARVDCPFFGIDLDPLALLADAWSLDAVFTRLGQQVRHVRARDGVRGSTGRVIAAELGAGQVDWPALTGALRDTDYRGAITLDPSELAVPPADAASRGLKRLRGWLA